MSTLTQIHYNYTPTTLDILKRGISEQVQHQSFTESSRVLEGLTAPEQRELCEFSRDIGHPYVVLPALWAPRKYAIHLIWVNLNPLDATAKSVLGDPAREESILKTIHVWREKNPSARVFLWHDEALVNPETKETLLQELCKKLAPSRCELKNIRSLFSSDSALFEQALHPCLPIYWRVDFARLMILATSPHQFPYNVVTDLDNKPMLPEVLFDEHTLQTLDTYGFVLSGISSHKYENSFATTKNKAETIHAIFNTLRNALSLLEYSSARQGISGNSILPLYLNCIIKPLFGSFDHYKKVQGWKIPDGPLSEYETQDVPDGDPRNDPNHPNPRFELACFERRPNGRPVFNKFLSWFYCADGRVSSETGLEAHWTPRVKRLQEWKPTHQS